MVYPQAPQASPLNPAFSGVPAPREDALRRRVLSGLIPYMGSAGANQLLASLGNDDQELGRKVESLLRVFLGGTANRLANRRHECPGRGAIGRCTASNFSWSPGCRIGWQLGEVESPSVIIATTACYLAGVRAFLVWQLTGNVEWVVEFFQGPAALLMLWLALLQFSLSLNATRNFSSDDFLRPAWMLIACSAGCQLVGSFLTQVLGRIPG